MIKYVQDSICVIDLYGQTQAQISVTSYAVLLSNTWLLWVFGTSTEQW